MKTFFCRMKTEYAFNSIEGAENMRVSISAILGLLIFLQDKLTKENVNITFTSSTYYLCYSYFPASALKLCTFLCAIAT